MAEFSKTDRHRSSLFRRISSARLRSVMSSEIAITKLRHALGAPGTRETLLLGWISHSDVCKLNSRHVRLSPGVATVDLCALHSQQVFCAGPGCVCILSRPVARINVAMTVRLPAARRGR